MLLFALSNAAGTVAALLGLAYAGSNIGAASMLPAMLLRYIRYRGEFSIAGTYVK